MKLQNGMFVDDNGQPMPLENFNEAQIKLLAKKELEYNQMKSEGIDVEFTFEIRAAMGNS